MIECPNCNANIKFDIASQRMLCQYCGTSMAPEEIVEKVDATETVKEPIFAEGNSAEEDSMETMVFTCPQCGGEILSYDDTAATFCTYCGSSTILSSRISKKMRPKYIIPFRKTKEECKEAYAKMIHGAFFLPREMREDSHISKFRSIYMPYWIYSFERQGPIQFYGVKRIQDEGYTACDVFTIRTELDVKYEGLSFDASSAFADPLSNAIAPFEWWGAKKFHTAYLSGFYADAGDVDPDLYLEDAKAIVCKDISDRLKKSLTEKECKGVEIGEGLSEEVSKLLDSKQELAMFPVWFLSYRNKDRVSYAVVNGQTGKVAGDLPVDKKRFMKWSCLWAFLLSLVLMGLCFFASVKAVTFWYLSVALAFLCTGISLTQKRELRARENYQDDKGKWYPVTPGKVWHITISVGKEVGTAIWTISIFLVLLAMGLTDASSGGSGVMLFGLLTVLIILWPVLLLLIPGFSYTTRNTSNLTRRDFVSTITVTGTGLLISWLIYFGFSKIPGLADLSALVAALVNMGFLVWDLFTILDQHNVLASREIPQFRKRGGDEDGK